MFRINMSHTSHDRMRELVAHDPRRSKHDYGRPIGILVDLQGPKLRRRRPSRDGSVMLSKGATLRARFRRRAGRRQARVICRIRKSLAALEPGHTLLLDDGKVRLIATEVDRGKRIDHARRGRRQAVGPQGRQPARHDRCRSRR